MNLNHLHLSVPDVSKARKFYEDFFGLHFAFEEDSGAMVFLRDQAGFLLALHASKKDEKIEFPSWFHFGFCQKSAADVKKVYERLKSAGVEFAKDLQEHPNWVTFSCWAPGPYKLEVSWDNIP